MVRGVHFRFSPRTGGNRGQESYKETSNYAPSQLSLFNSGADSLTLEQLDLLPNHDWHLKLSEHWEVSEDAAIGSSNGPPKK